MSKLKIASTVLAVAVLGGALGYYNFVDKPPVSSVAVGTDCPNFIAKPYDVKGDTFSVSNDVFTLAKQRGKVCVINFWEVWCSGCIMELAEFNRVQEEYKGEVQVVAIIGATSKIDAAANWLSNKNWKTLDPDHDWATFSLTFAHLPASECETMGYNGFLPRTIVVDKEGKVVSEQNASMTYETLKSAVEEALH